MTDFTISTLATTLAEGSVYSFSITPKTALAAAIKVRWEIVADGKLPISADDFATFTGTVDFASGARLAQTVTITPTDDAALEADQNFQIRIYQVVGDDDSTTSQTDDILLGAQAVRLDDNDVPTPTTPPTPSLFGESTPASNGEGNVNTAANTQDFALNAKGGNDTYIITRYQSGDVKIAESAGIDLIKFDFGVFIAQFAEVSTSNFTRLKIEAAILTLSTGAKIEIEFPDRTTSFQLGDDAIITSYAAFKTAIGASGTNATATFIAESYEVTAFTTTPDVSANTIEVAAEVLESTGSSDVIGLGGVADVSANGAGGDDTFVITRFQTGDVEIDDTVGTNLIKFDFGVQITAFSEASRISFGAKTVSLATLTLSTGAEIEISFPAGAFRFQLGDDTVIETYAAFKTAIGASGSNAASALLAAKTIFHPSVNAPTIGAVVITHVELSLPSDKANVGEVLTAVTTNITDADDATLTFTYQWKKLGSDTVLGNATTYAPTAVGDYTVTVIATDSVKPSSTIFTSAAAEVVAVNFAPMGAVTVTDDVPPPSVTVEGLVFTAKAGGAAISIAFKNTGSGNLNSTLSDQFLLIDYNANNPAQNTLGEIFALLQGNSDVIDNFILTTDVASYDEDASSTVLDTLNNAASYSAYNLVQAPIAVGTTLTANTSALRDADGLGTLNYQWLRDGDVLSGQTSSTYTLVAGDIGKPITVRVSYTDDEGTAETVTSVVENTAPTGALTVSSDAAILPVNIEGLVFTAKEGGAAISIAFNNIANNVPFFTTISSNTLIIFYNATKADINTLGKVFTGLQGNANVANNFVLTTDVASYDATANSAVLDPIIDNVSNIFNLAHPPIVGTVLTADTSTIADADGLGTFSYQWLRGGAEISANATSSTYTLVADDVGKVHTVRVSYTDVKGTAESFTSTNADTATTGAVTITHAESSAPTNAANVGEVLTAGTTNLTDADDHELTFTYQWKLAGSDVSGATAKTYTPTAIGNYSVVVTAADDVNNANTAITSAAFEVVATVNTAPTGALTVNPAQTFSVNVHGLVFTAKAGGAADAATVIRFENTVSNGYAARFESNALNVDLSAVVASRDTLGEVLTFLQEQSAVKDNFILTTGAGYDEDADSVILDADSGVSSSAPTSYNLVTMPAAPILSVNIHGLVFTAKAGGVANAQTRIGLRNTSSNGLANFISSRNTFEISYDATKALQDTFGELLTFLGKDAGIKNNFVVTTGAGYDATAATSLIDVADSTSTFYALTPTSTYPTGTVFTANTATLADADGFGTFSYQWLRAGADISGAESVTYTTKADDAGKTITVRVSYTDVKGTAESVTSIVGDTPTTGTVRITHAETSLPTNAANVGETLTAVTTDLTDADDADLTFTYQWKLGGTDISGATAKTHVAAAVGAYSVTVTAIDDVNTVNNTNTALTSAAFEVVDATFVPIVAGDYTEFKTGDGALANTLNAGSKTSAQLIQGGALVDTITASNHGDVIAGGTGDDIISLVQGGAATTVVHRFARSGTDWTNSDGTDTIGDFQRGTDKFVFVDTSGTPITSLSAFLTALATSDAEARVESLAPGGPGYGDKIVKLEIRFGDNGGYLTINFSGEAGGAKLQTSASVSGLTATSITPTTSNGIVHTVTDFTVLDDLFGAGGLEITSTADLGVTIL